VNGWVVSWGKSWWGSNGVKFSVSIFWRILDPPPSSSEFQSSIIIIPNISKKKATKTIQYFPRTRN
jgi:hypothetical protein